MSMRSDRSKGTPKDLKEQEVTENVMERPDSPLSSVSVRSDASRFIRPDVTWEGSRVSAGRVLCDVCPTPAVKTCLTCGDSYCMTCIRPHYSDPDLERHQLQDLQDQSLCQQHHKQLKFYCWTDQSAICSRCYHKDHNGHDVVEQAPTATCDERTEQVGMLGD
ncbi:tripartite motif-containing protein 16-like [Clupea harengus]|uniref:Tripartite motif-containing protein 16-like n=1 Tax=Clupea harengus TaxID=7950 RepID=A0A6P8GLG8_CLUHA|nr:tripartite motif-containing protein 16-like [Clupea harengus]